jgi:hypothetical protein
MATCRTEGIVFRGFVKICSKPGFFKSSKRYWFEFSANGVPTMSFYADQAALTPQVVETLAPDSFYYDLHWNPKGPWTKGSDPGCCLQIAIAGVKFLYLETETPDEGDTLSDLLFRLLRKKNL